MGFFFQASNVIGREGGSVLNDLQCVRAAVAGDQDAYGRLVAKYQGQVYRVCLKITGRHDAAEDLAQEVFIKAYNALGGFRGDASFSTWLYRITVRKGLDWRRNEERERWRTATACDARERPALTPEQTLLEKERRAEIRELIERLKDPYRTVVRLFYLERCSYQEIANRTGVPLKTVESQLYRARRMMRERGKGLR